VYVKKLVQKSSQLKLKASQFVVEISSKDSLVVHTKYFSVSDFTSPGLVDNSINYCFHLFEIVIVSSQFDYLS
jgi:hypothetical protein